MYSKPFVIQVNDFSEDLTVADLPKVSKIVHILPQSLSSIYAPVQCEGSFVLLR